MLTMFTSDVDGPGMTGAAEGAECGRRGGNGWSSVQGLVRKLRMSETASCCSLEVLL